MAELDQFYGPNAGYVLDLLERYQRDPSQADAAALAGLRSSAEVTPSVATVEPDISAAASAAALAQSIRFYGYLGARLDPLGAPPPGDPQLDAATHHLNDEDLRRLPASVVGGPLGARLARNASACDAIGRLRVLYCATSGFDFAHIAEPDERDWLLESIETERFRPPADPVDERGLLDRLTEVSAFERFLQRAYPGQTRFSVEGLGMLIPMLDELIAVAAEDGARTIVLGHGTSRPAQRAGARAGQALRADPGRIRGAGARSRGGRRRPHGRGLDRRRQVPRGRTSAHPRRWRGPRQRDRRPGSEPQPSRIRGSSRPGHGPRRWRGPARCAGIRARRRHDARRADPRRRLVPRPGRGRRNAQPVAPSRLPDRRDAAHHHQQPARLHDAARRRSVDPVRQRPGKGLRDSDRARQRRRSDRLPGRHPAGRGLPCALPEGRV